jgi:ribosomal protein L19E
MMKSLKEDMTVDKNQYTNFYITWQSGEISVSTVIRTWNTLGKAERYNALDNSNTVIPIFE